MRRPTTNASGRGLRSDQGVSLVIVVMTVTLLISLAGGALFFSGLNLKASSNLKTGTGAIHVADAAIQHALALIPPGSDFDLLLTGGVAGFSCASPCDGDANKPTLTGSMSGYSYTVVAENDPAESSMPTDDTNRVVVLRATATGPDGSTRRVLAYVGRSGATWRPPGAVYIPGSPATVATSNFEGTGWRISGRDTLADGREGSGPERPIPGIATNTDSLRDEIIGSLTLPQNNMIDGEGSGPSVANPSVVNTGSTLDPDRLAQDLLNLGVEGVDKQTITPSSSLLRCSGGSWGTASQPQITYITRSQWTELQLVGNCTGYGVLITDPSIDVHIAGNFRWYGLIIARRHPHFNPNHFGRNPENGGHLYGSPMVKESSLGHIDMGGTSKIFYSSHAITSYVLSRWAQAFPQPARILAWSELMN